MMGKIVSQLNADGYFVGPAIADASPLEPNVYLLPGGAIDISPPLIPDNKVAKWVGEWVFEDDKSIPKSVTRRQALLALLAADKLDEVELIVQNSPRAVQIAWESAGTFERDNPLIGSLGSKAGLSSDDIDHLFEQAAKL